MFRRALWLAILAASFNPLPSIPQTLPVKGPDAIALHGEALGPPIRQVEGVTETVTVPMVTEPWAGSPTPRARVKNRRIHRIGHFPGFQEAKRKANEAQSRLLEVPKAVAAPPAEPRTASAGIVFDGPSESDTNLIPPDPVIAAGPSHVVVLINSLLAIYDKVGVQQGAFQDLSAFFGSLGISGEIYDPRVVYDQVDGRFILSAAEADLTNFTNGHVMVAVSQTSDPTGAWNKFAIDFKGRNLANTANTFPDFPTLGLSSSAVYISTGQFALNAACLLDGYCAFSDTWINVVGLSELLSGNSTLNITTFKDVRTASDNRAFVIQPAVTYGDSPEEFLIAADFSWNPSSRLNLFLINVSGTPTLATVDFLVPAFSIPPDAPQQNGSSKIATNDYRLLNAVRSNNSLWCAHNVADLTGANPVARWYEIDVSSLATAGVRQVGTIAGLGAAFFSAIAVNAGGEASVVFSTSSESSYASAGYTGRASSDEPNTMRAYTVYRQGTAPYEDFATRWGDYSGIALDPDGNTFWIIAEYAGSPNPHFGTAVASVAGPLALIISPGSLDFGNQPLGVTSAPLSATLTNGGAEPLQISSITLAGLNAGDFGVSQDSCSVTVLDAGESCAIGVTFTPTAAGARIAGIILTYSIGVQQSVTTISLTGIGGSSGTVGVIPTNLTFPATPISTASAPQTVTVSNGTNGSYMINEVRIGGDYAQTNDCPSVLAPGARCTINVTFRPILTGSRSYLLSFGEIWDYKTVTLDGFGVTAPAVTPCPSRVTFPDQVVGTTSDEQLITVTNTGSETLNVTAVSVSGDFTQTNTCSGGVPERKACHINVRFSPTAPGNQSGTITLTDNAAGSPHVIQLSGNGISASQMRGLSQGPSKVAPSAEIPDGFAQKVVSAPDQKRQLKLKGSFGRLPSTFEVNHGQTDERVLYLSRAPDFTLFLTRDEAVFALRGRSAPTGLPEESVLDRQSTVIRTRLVGANSNTRVTALQELTTRSHYFIGRDPRAWRRDIPHFAKVKYEDVYPGIDLVYYGSPQQLEYDFIVNPGAKPNSIELQICGARDARRDAEGDLVLGTPAGDFRLHHPVAYQEIAGLRHQVEADYFLDARRHVHIRAEGFDSRFPLIIDPVVSYSTFLGGTYGDVAAAVVVDSLDNIYIAGSTYSSDFPTANPQGGNELFSPGLNVFVAKLTPDASTLISTFFLGGSGDDSASGLAIDSLGNIYVAGNTNSRDFPLANPIQSQLGGGTPSTSCFGEPCGDSFATMVDASGSGLVYSTYLGGTEEDISTGVAVDQAGNAYLAGYTNSLDFPTTPEAFQTKFAGRYDDCYYSLYHGCGDAFVTKIIAGGSALGYSTFLGGSRNERVSSIAIGPDGSPYVTGATGSLDFPTTPGAYQQGSAGFDDVFVTKLSPDGRTLGYSTYLGGRMAQSYSGGDDVGWAIHVDSSGNAYVTGATTSSGFPVVTPLVEPGPGLFTFVSKLHPEGCALPSSTTIAFWLPQAIALDNSGNIYVTGATQGGYPLVNPLQNTCLGCGPGWQDAFVAKFDPSASQLLFSTFLGGSVFDKASGIAVDSQANIVVVGWTSSTDYPTMPRAFQPNFPGTVDYPFSNTRPTTFITKISPQDLPAAYLTPNPLTFGDQPVGSTGDSQTVAVRNMGSAPLTVSSVATSGDFLQTNTCGLPVPGGDTCSIAVTFSPSASGTRTGTVTVVSDAAESPLTVSLIGTGIDAPYTSLSPTALSFSNQDAGTSSPPQTVELKNIGNLPLTINGIYLWSAASDFTQTNNCGSSIDPGAGCQIEVVFTPHGPFERYGSLSVEDNADFGPSYVGLTGTGIGPWFSESSYLYPFGDQVLNTTSRPETATLNSSGNAPLTLSVSTTGNFAQTNNCVSPMSPGTSCTVSVTFTPTAPGTRTGELRVIHNAPESPFVYPLEGRGTDFALSASPSSATVKAGQSATYTLTLTPLGGFSWSVSLGCSGAPSKATCKVTPSPVVSDGTNPVTAEIKVTTTAPSMSAPESPRIPPASWKVFARHWFAYLLCLTALAMAASWLIARRKRLRAAWLTFAGIVLVLSLWASCGGGGGISSGGGGGGHPGTPPGTYSLTVSGSVSTPTGDAVERSVKISLTVN